jgi:hypothetical protein
MAAKVCKQTELSTFFNCDYLRRSITNWGRKYDRMMSMWCIRMVQPLSSLSTCVRSRAHPSSQATPIACVYTTSMPWLSASENSRLHEYSCSLGNQSVSFHDLFCWKKIIRKPLRASSGIRRRLQIETHYPWNQNQPYISSSSFRIRLSLSTQNVQA